MVFGPHPDDEGLGCANVISQALRKEKKVKVIVVANGESSVDGTEWFYGHPPQREDFVNIGRVRQKETIEAMKVLGLAEEEIIFLGYPNDGILKMMSSDECTPDKPYRSEFTGFDRVTYENSYNMGAPFCKESILEDVGKIISDYNPHEVYVTHHQDSHYDHKACGKMVFDLTRKINPSAKVRGYLISPSRIPSEKQRMVYKSTGQLREIHLSESEKELKKRCIEQYKSQSFLFDQLAFHYDVERFFKMEQGMRIKMARMLKPDLVY